MTGVRSFRWRPEGGLWVLCLGALSLGARGKEEIAVDLTQFVKTNIPDMAGCVSPRGLSFTTIEPSPKGEPYFYVTYRVDTPQAGSYRLSIKGPGSGARGYSRYSMAIDDLSPLPVPLTWRVGEEKEGWHDQGPFPLGSGKHALEFRFYPDQRMRQMNRVTEPYVGHKVRIEGVRLSLSAPRMKTDRRDRGLLLGAGQKVVLLGDSITEEGFYAGHLARLLKCAYPGEEIELFNSGVSLNRTWEGLDRLEGDVLALRPDWVVLAFGVNDSVHMAPDVFRSTYAQLVKRLKKEKIKVICATPSGMSPEPDKENRYFHTPDRARAFDRTMAVEAGIVLEIARQLDVYAADVFGAFTQSGLPRPALMGSQWHPSEEGGRAFAVALLHALGFSKEDAEKSGDPKDVLTYLAISSMPRPVYPAYQPQKMSAVGASAEDAWVVASSFTENSVFAFSKSTGKKVGSVPVGHHPMGIAYSGKRRELYVACEGSGRLDVIRTPEFEWAGSIPLGDVYPVSIAVSEDQTAAWVGTFFGGSVLEVDLDKRIQKRSIPIGALVEGVALPRGGAVVLAAVREKGILFIDAVEGEIQSTVRATPYAASFVETHEGRVSVIDTAEWTLSPIDVKAKRVDPPVRAPFESRAILMDPDTDEIWAGDWKNGRIVRIPRGSAALPFAAVEFPFGIAIIHPTGGR